MELKRDPFQKRLNELEYESPRAIIPFDCYVLII